MTKKLILSIFFVSFLFWGFETKAQCSFNNNFYVDLTPSGAGATAIDNCVYGGDLITVNVISGEQYHIRSCNNSSLWDSEITLYDAAGTTVLGYDDNSCSPYSEIYHTASYTGILNVMVHESSCNTNTTCMTLEVTQIIPPGISTIGTLTAFTSCSGSASAYQSFEVLGSNLSANLIVTPNSSDFEVSLDGINFNNSETLTPSSGTVANTPIYVRLKSTASGTPSGNIECASTGYTQKDVAVAGTVNPILSGTYTVGSGGDYSTLTEAAAIYNTSCLGGSVVFSLIDNAYNSLETFPITILANADASSTNTLTIKPATGKNPVISGDSPDLSSLLLLQGADYIIIDGSNATSGTSRDLSFINSNTTGTTAVLWVGSYNSSNGATNNIIKNCEISGNSSINTLFGIYSGDGVLLGLDAEEANNNNTYQNNEIIKAMYGITIVGVLGNESGLEITGNRIGSTVGAEKLGYSGIFVAFQNGLTISDNSITGIDNTIDDDFGAGILVGGTIGGGSIVRNTISDIKNTLNDFDGGWGISGILLLSASSNIDLTIANNFISDITGYGYEFDPYSNGIGIKIEDGHGYNVWHNTVVMNTNQDNTVGYSTALWIEDLDAGAVDLRNNILVNAQNSGVPAANRYSIICEGTSNSIFSNIDYNNYYTTGTNIGFINGNDCSSLSALQSNFGSNTNSKNTLPVFAGASDFHLNAVNIGFDNMGTYLSQVNTDFDNENRSNSSPDIGADEFTSSNTFTYTGSGNWTDAGNWTPSYPGITIPSGITVVNTSGTLTINGITVTNNGTVKNNGTLFNSGTFNNNGTYKGSGAYPVSVFTNPVGGLVSPGD